MPQYKVQLNSAVSGPLNPAYMDFTVRATSSDQQQAQVLCYAAACLGSMSEQDTTIGGMVERTTIGSGPWIPVPFPTALYASTRTEANTALGSALIKALTDYGQATLGPTSATSSGRGDSVCVNTRASTGGRHGRGRHFIPFANRDTVLTDGLLNPLATVYVENAYRLLFKGVGAGATIVDLDPAVWSPTTTTNYGIDIVQVNQIPSRLRSRTK